MANVNKPFGLRPIGNLSATGAQKQYGYQIADNQSGAIFQGDLVVVYDGYIIKYDPATHTAVTGVFNGCNYVDPTSGKPTWKNYYPGSISANNIIANVIDDPNVVYTVASDESFANADLFANYNIVTTAGNTASGVSKEVATALCRGQC